MTRINKAALISIFMFMYLLVGPFAFGYVGDIYFHVVLLFQVVPYILIVLFIGTLIEECTGG